MSISDKVVVIQNILNVISKVLSFADKFVDFLLDNIPTKGGDSVG